MAGMGPMTISIDCRMLNASGGIGVYLQECLPLFLDYPYKFLLIGSREKLALIAGHRENAVILDNHIKPFSLRELFLFSRSILKKINRTDIFYTPYFNIPSGITIPVYSTIHDIIFPDMPGLSSKTGLAVRMWFYRRAMRLSRKIFTVSEFSKSRIQHYLGTDKPVIVTHSAIRAYLFKRSGTGGTKKKILLFVGNIKRHKGLWCLLDAFFASREEGLDYKLVIVGSRENFRSRDAEVLRQLEHLDSTVVEFTGSISNERLRDLFAEAALLVQPSLYEGFGLPPLEAMVMGTGALISDIPIFREIYGEFPVTFFRAGDSKDLKEKLLALLHHKIPEPITLSENLINKYTFKKTTTKIVEGLIS
jgi:glycosyltransferase involved in cell wall biosynthesis